MANITLDTGATSITIAGPKYPDEPGESAPVVVGRTMGGGVKVANLGRISNRLNSIFGKCRTPITNRYGILYKIPVLGR